MNSSPHLKRPAAATEIDQQPHKRARVTAPAQIKELHTIGYTIFRAAFEPASLLTAVKKQASRARPIFNHNETMAGNDRKRLQCNLKVTAQIKMSLHTIEAFVTKTLQSPHHFSPWVLLHSLPGCRDQANHVDYVPAPDLAAASDEQMPLAVLVSLMPDTHLHVYDRSIRLSTTAPASLGKKRINRKTVSLGAGDILVFRGDLVHAGSGYEKDNYRLHAYMDSEYVYRTPNRTWLIKEHGSEDLRHLLRND